MCHYTQDTLYLVVVCYSMFIFTEQKNPAKDFCMTKKIGKVIHLNDPAINTVINRTIYSNGKTVHRLKIKMLLYDKSKTWNTYGYITL